MRKEKKKVINIGCVVAYPTESFYALGVNATDTEAVQKLFRLKRREHNKPIALIAADLKQVKEFFFLSAAEEKLARKYWPGALTILLKPKTPSSPNPSSGRRGGISSRVLGTRRIGVRVPSHAGARRLARQVGAPITATSANISGQPPTKSYAKIKRDFPGILIRPGRCGRQTKPSTVIEIRRHRVNVIRPGSRALTKINNRFGR